MTPNTQRGLLQIADRLQTQPEAPAQVGPVQGSGGSEAFHALASDFGGLARQLSGWADEAARIEGAREGAQAGLDPSFVPKRDITIRAEAYDRAGLSTAQSMLEVHLRDSIQRLHEQFAHDPKALEGALAQKRSEMLKALPADEMRPHFETSFAAASQSALASSRHQFMADTAARQQAALQDEIATRKRSLEQQAMQTGLDPQSDKALASELESLRVAMSVKGPGGGALVAPDAQRKILEDAKSDLVRARTIGTFDKLPTLEAKERFVASIERAWSSGEGAIGQLSGDQSLHLFSDMRKQLSAAKMERNIGLSALRDQVHDFATEAEKGRGPSDAELTELRARVQTSGNPHLAHTFDLASAALAFQKEARVATPAELDAFIQRQAPLVNEGEGGRIAGHQLDLALKLKHEMETQLVKDPLGWAERTGQIKVAPIDFSEGKVDASLRARIAQADAVAEKYGIAPRYFRPPEAEALANAAGKGGPALIGISGAIVSALGERAPAALAEITKHAPEVAALGSMAADGAAPAAINDAAAGIVLRRSPDFKSRIPDRKRQESDTSAVAGNAFQMMPQTQDALMDAAAAIYEMRARRSGRPEYDGPMYQKALQEAAGAVEANGYTYGGIGNDGSGALWGGQRILIPPGVRSDAFRDVVRSISQIDLDRAGVKAVDAKGRQLPIETLHGARFVSLGSSKYLVALSDPSEANFQAAGDGNRLDRDGAPKPLVIDLAPMLPALRQRNPQYFLGGK